MRGWDVAGAVLLGLGGLVAGCCGSRGTLEGPGPDTRFVTEPSRLLVQTAQGIEEIRLDGRERRVVFRGSFRVLDVSPDRTTYLLSDTDTNLLVGHRADGSIGRVPELDRRLSAAAFSPDGRTIAAVRHADFDLPQASWKDDDAIFLIDAATLAVDPIAPSSSDWPASVQWSADGKALWLPMNFDHPAQWVEVATRARSRPGQAAPAPLRPSPLAPPTCPATLLSDRQMNGVRIQDTPSTAPRRLVRLVGRRRGFHDYQHDFDHLAMSPGCAYGLFEHEQRIWVVDARTGTFGPLIEGWWLFFEPD